MLNCVISTLDIYDIVSATCSDISNNMPADLIGYWTRAEKIKDKTKCYFCKNLIIIS